MALRGAKADPTASGGSDSNAVGASGLQLGLRTSGGSSSYTNDGTGFNGCGSTVRTALANQANLSSDGAIFTVSRAGGAGGAQSNGQGGGNAGAAGTTGGVTLTTGGGGSGGVSHNNSISGNPVSGGAGGAGTCFSGGSGGGGGHNNQNNTVHSGAAGAADTTQHALSDWVATAVFPSPGSVAPRGRSRGAEWRCARSSPRRSHFLQKRALRLWGSSHHH